MGTERRLEFHGEVARPVVLDDLATSSIVAAI